MKRWIIWIWGALIFASCFDDKGNYDYVDIGDLVITGVETNRWYELFAFSDTLSIPVDIQSTRYTNGEMPYTYEWKLESVNAKTQKGDTIFDYTVSRQKDLNIVPMLSAGEYFGFFIVTDTLLGLRQKVDFFVRLKTSTSEGWMILCEQNGKARLDWISNLGPTTDRIYRDLWSNSDIDLGKPYGISFSHYPSRTNRYVYVENGVYNLDKEDAHVGDDNNIRWQFGDQPDRLQGAANLIVWRNNSRDLLVSRDKELYIRGTGPREIYGFPINRTTQGERYDVAPYLGYAYNGNVPVFGASVVIYDETNRRFVEIVDDGSNIPRTLTFVGGSKNFDAWTGRDLVFMDWTTDKYVFAVLKEPNNEDMYVYGIRLEKEGNYRDYYMPLKRPNNDKITHFAIHSLHHYLFYATDKGEIYRFDISHPEDEAVRVLSFPGETITALKVNKFVFPGRLFKYEPWELERENRLVIGSYVTAEVEQGNDLDCGIMRTYDVPDLRQPMENKQVKYHDKLGKIVDIVYRERDK